MLSDVIKFIENTYMPNNQSAKGLDPKCQTLNEQLKIYIMTILV